MPNDDRILDVKLIAELITLKDIYNKLDDEKKVSLRQKVPLLSGTLEEINPQNATYSQIRTLARLSTDAGEFELAFGVLQRFKETLVYKASVVDYILDKALIIELTVLKNSYTALSDTDKAALDKNAPLLSTALKNINPTNATYDQIRELTKVSAAAGKFESALGVLRGFKETEVYKRATVQNLDKLTHSPLRHGFTYMNPEDKANVEVATSRGFLHPHDRMKRLGQALLSHTIKGNQDTVVAMLKHYPELLLYRGNVRDYSGREFKNVTAFELALWALDVHHMIPAMLACLTDNEEHKDYSKELVPELQKQFDDLEKEGGGVNYSIGCSLLKLSRDPSVVPPNETPEQRNKRLNLFSRLFNRHNGCIQYNDRIFYFHNLSYPKNLVEIKDPNAIIALQGLMNKERKLEEGQLPIINNDDELEIIQKNVSGSRHIFKEKHYDFKPLTDALDVYVHSFDAGSIWTWELGAHWFTVVGLAQHYAPAHVAHHYCNPDESFDPKNNNTPPKFDEKELKRKLNFDNLISNKMEPWSWWPSSVMTDSKVLGLDFGIVRGRRWKAGADDMVGLAQHMFVSMSGADVDFEALTALCEIRTSEMLELKQLLAPRQKPDTGSGPASYALQ